MEPNLAQHFLHCTPQILGDPGTTGLHLRHQLAAGKIQVRSQRCQKPTSISNQLENQGYSTGFEVSLLLSGVQIIAGLFFTWKALHTHPHDPRGENIPFQQAAEAKLCLTSHFRASASGYPHLGFWGSTRDTGGNTGWILAALMAGRMPGSAVPSIHSHPGTERWKVWRQSFPCRSLPEFPIPPDSLPKHVRKQNSFWQAGLKRWK